MYGSPNDTAGVRRRSRRRDSTCLTPNAHGPDRVGLVGRRRLASPRNTSSPRVEEFNRDPKAPFTMRMAVPADFEAAIAAPHRPARLQGRAQPDFPGDLQQPDRAQGLDAAHGAAVAHRREAERARRPGWARPPISARSWAAWEPVLFNETHDLASGVMTDHVYDDTIRSYEYSKRRADAIIDAKWDVLAVAGSTPAGRVRRSSSSTRWAGRARTSPRSISASAKGASPASMLTDPDGQAVPAQIVESTRYGDGGLKTARVAFIARDVPALGYCDLSRRRQVASPERRRAAANTAAASRREVVLENELYRVDLDPATGAITQSSTSSRRLGGALRAAATSSRASKTAAISGSSTRAWTAAAGSP